MNNDIKLSKKHVNGWILIVILLVSFVVSGIKSAYAQTAEKDNLAVIFIVDDSGSMAGSDPANLRYTAIKLMVSAMDLGDQVGLIQFSTNSKIVTEGFVELSSNEEKNSLIDSIIASEPSGYTDFKAAFLSTDELLTTKNPENYQTVAIFLTDGRPDVPDHSDKYDEEVISLAKSLEIPIYAIGLTPLSQTAILSRIASETGGKLVPAETSSDLLDSYLQILGELKDRTVINSDYFKEFNSHGFFLDPSLVQYITKITFIISKNPNVEASIVAPSGEKISDENVSVSFIKTDDPNFITITIDSPISGYWLIDAPEGNGNYQAKAILRSRLRTRITSPEGLIQAGKPVLIVASIVEELDNGNLMKVVGSADFSVEILLPDGSIQSLDRLYDDGTHGDILANDGNYSREFVDTFIEGTYSINLIGQKELIPIFTFHTFTAVKFPELQLINPIESYIEVRNSPIEVLIESDLNLDDLNNLEGYPSVFVTDPDDLKIQIELKKNGKSFNGSFRPTKNGIYTIRIDTQMMFFRGLPINQVISKQITIKIIPTIVVEDWYFGYDEPLPNSRFDISYVVNNGIPLVIKVSSNSSQKEFVKISVGELAGFDLLENVNISILPNMSNEISLQLKPIVPISPGFWNGFLILNPISNVDIIESRLPISFEIYQKSITLGIKDVMVSCQKLLCFKVEPIEVILNTNSNDIKEQMVYFNLEGIENSNIINATQYIQPGDSEIIIKIKIDDPINTTEYDGTISFTSSDPDIILLDKKGGEDLRFSFAVPSLWERCKWHFFFTIIIVYLVFVLVRTFSRSFSKKIGKPIVTGTFIYWPKNDPNNQFVIDLSSKKLPKISVGSKSDCDIIINDPSVDELHFYLMVNRTQGNNSTLLEPVRRVSVGYRNIVDSEELDENNLYEFGDFEFRFIPS